MGRIIVPRKLSVIFDKYKYVALVVVLGLLLMLWPTKQSQGPAAQDVSHSDRQQSVSEELCAILGQIRGVGRVRVMITQETGPRTHYQTDESDTQNAETSANDRRTVLISSGGDEEGLIESISSPVYLGAIVVCQGADDPAVRLAVAQAVSAVTGISTDRISVLKMK